MIIIALLILSMLCITEASPRILQSVIKDETANVKTMCQNFPDRSSLVGGKESEYEAYKKLMQGTFTESG
jgi:hypothetical protein